MSLNVTCYYTCDNKLQECFKSARNVIIVIIVIIMIMMMMIMMMIIIIIIIMLLDFKFTAFLSKFWLIIT